MQTYNIFILIDNVFASKKHFKAIKAIKIITKNCKYLISTQSIKFNGL